MRVVKFIEPEEPDIDLWETFQYAGPCLEDYVFEFYGNKKYRDRMKRIFDDTFHGRAKTKGFSKERAK
jgi:hypothetical protein